MIVYAFAKIRLAVCAQSPYRSVPVESRGKMSIQLPRDYLAIDGSVPAVPRLISIEA